MNKLTKDELILKLITIGIIFFKNNSHPTETIENVIKSQLTFLSDVFVFELLTESDFRYVLFEIKISMEDNNK